MLLSFCSSLACALVLFSASPSSVVAAQQEPSDLKTPGQQQLAPAGLATGLDEPVLEDESSLWNEKRAWNAKMNGAWGKRAWNNLQVRQSSSHFIAHSHITSHLNSFLVSALHPCVPLPLDLCSSQTACYLNEATTAN